MKSGKWTDGWRDGCKDGSKNDMCETEREVGVGVRESERVGGGEREWQKERASEMEGGREERAPSFPSTHRSQLDGVDPVGQVQLLEVAEFEATAASVRVRSKVVICKIGTAEVGMVEERSNVGTEKKVKLQQHCCKVS